MNTPEVIFFTYLTMAKQLRRQLLTLNVPETGNWNLEELLADRKVKQAARGRMLEIATGDINEKGAEIWNITSAGK